MTRRNPCRLFCRVYSWKTRIYGEKTVFERTAKNTNESIYDTKEEKVS